MENDGLILTSISKKNYGYYECILPEYYRTTFRRTPQMQAVGAAFRGRAAGILLFTEDWDLHFCRVHYIAVSPDFRRRGIAREMLVRLARAAYEEVLYTTAAFLAQDMHDPVYRLFSTCGEFTIVEREDAVYSAGKDELKEAMKKLSLIHAGKKKPKGLLLSACPKDLLNRIVGELGREEFDIPMLLERADPNLSQLTLDKNGNLKALILTEDLYDENVFLLSFGWTRNDPVAFMQLLMHVFADLYKAMDDISQLQITAVDENVKEIMNKLFLDKTVVSRLYEAAYNGEDPM